MAWDQRLSPLTRSNNAYREGQSRLTVGDPESPDPIFPIPFLVKIENASFTANMSVSHEAIVHPEESWLAQLLISWHWPGGNWGGGGVW